MNRRVVFAAVTFVLCLAMPVSANSLDEALEQILQVGELGKGHKQARAAVAVASQASADELLTVFAAMDQAGPLAANWLRAVVDTIAERTLAAGGELPLPELDEFLFDNAHGPNSRRLAFEWIVAVQPDARDELLGKLLDDSSLELRFDAVARVIEQATDAEAGDKKELYQRALKAARNRDQIQQCAKALEELGEKVDLVEHMGFLMKWQLIGPFDNSDRKGLAVAYPPEEMIDLDATHRGKENEVAWSSYSSEHVEGMVDLNEALDKHKGAVAYAYAEIVYDDIPENAQIRLGCINGHKVWVNGELIDTNDVYHTGMSVDQYVNAIKLRKGRNQILLKICQNEQTESWAQQWQFQVRITDALGASVSGRVVNPIANQQEQE